MVFCGTRVLSGTPQGGERRSRRRRKAGKWRARKRGLLTDVKAFLRSALGLPPDVILAALGLGVYLTTCFVAGRSLGWGWALVPGLCLSLLIEAAEIREHHGARVLFQADAKELVSIGLRHARDVGVMNLVPLMVVIAVNLLGRTAEG